MDTKMDKNFKKLADELVQDKSSIKDKISSIENKILLKKKRLKPRYLQ